MATLYVQIASLSASLLAISGPASAPPAAAVVPHPPALRAVPDPQSDEAQRELADEQAKTLNHISITRPSVAQRFIVGWETHRGYFLTPVDGPAEFVVPDFLDKRILGRFDDLFRPGAPAHIGEKLICDCTGVKWSFYSSHRFLVREAKLTWMSDGAMARSVP